MSDNSKEIELMRQIIEKKKAKSASQGSIKKGPEDFYGNTRPSNKKNKKGGGLSPK